MWLKFTPKLLCFYPLPLWAKLPSAVVSALLSDFKPSEAQQAIRANHTGLSGAEPTCGSGRPTAPGYRPGCSWPCSARSPQTPETGLSLHWASEHTHTHTHTHTGQ